MLLLVQFLTVGADAIDVTHRGGDGFSTNSSSDSSAASNYPYSEKYAEAVRPCRIECGPDKDGYMFYYYCLRAAGEIRKDGMVVKRFEYCRRPGNNIQCGSGDDPSHFTIFGRPYTRAEGMHNHRSVPLLECRG